MSQIDYNPNSISEIIRHNLIALISLNSVQPQDWKLAPAEQGRYRKIMIKGQVVKAYKGALSQGDFFTDVEQTVSELEEKEDYGPWSTTPPAAGARYLVFCQRGNEPFYETLSKGCKRVIREGAKYPPFAVQDVERSMASGGGVSTVGGMDARQDLYGARQSIGPIYARYLVDRTSHLPLHQRTDLFLPLIKAPDSEITLREELLFWLMKELPYDDSSREVRSRLASVMFEILGQPAKNSKPLQRNLIESYLYATVFHHYGEPSHIKPHEVFGHAPESHQNAKGLLQQHPFQAHARDHIHNWMEGKV